jgi:hypothetical protein
LKDIPDLHASLHSYSAWDASGLPTHTAGGVALTDKERAALGKDVKGRAKAVEALAKRVTADGFDSADALLASLAADLADHEAKLADLQQKHVAEL